MTSRPLHLVAGGAGFVGSCLVRLLATRGRVRVLDNLSTGREENLVGVPGVELVRGSLLDQTAVDEALEGVTTVFDLACAGVRHSIHAPLPNHEVNATGTLRLLDSSLRVGVRRFVYVSSSEVYGTALRVPMDELHPTFPHTVYGAGKLAGEAYARAYHRTYGLETVIVRPFNTYGPRSHHEGDAGELVPRFLVRLMNGLPPVIFGSGKQARDFTYVEDIAAGIMAAGARDVVGETLNLGSGTARTVDEVARLLCSTLGRPDLHPTYVESRPGDVEYLIAESTRAATKLGWAPRVSFEEGIRRLIRWYQESGLDWAQALREERLLSWLAPPTTGVVTPRTAMLPDPLCADVASSERPPIRDDRVGGAP